MRRACVTPIVSLFALLCPYVPLAAQMLDMQPGARVRVSAAGALAGRLTGIVMARTADSLTLARSNAGPITVPIARLTRAELSRGKSHGLGAIKGLVLGAGVGLLLGLTPIPESDCGSGRCDVKQSRAEFMGQMMVGAGGLGAGIGAIAGSERWERYAMLKPVSLALPLRHGVVGVSARWALRAR